MVEKDVVKQVQNYLEGLGYSRYLFSSDVRTYYNEKIDLVVYRNEIPYIVVDIKSDEQLFNKKDPDEELLFNPYVRQTQVYATFLNAPYYLLTNGSSFLWFTTSDSGLPKWLPNPVQLLQDEVLSEDDVVRVLQNLRDFFLKNGVSALRDEAAMVIYAKLLDELGDHRLEEGLIASQEAYNPSSRSDIINGLLREILRSPFYVREPSYYGLNKRKHSYYAYAFEIINRIVFRDVTPQALLTALDKIFIGEPIPNDGPRVSRWLADFLVRLSQIQAHDAILDIYSNFGDIAASILLSNEDGHHLYTNIVGISPNTTSALWAQIQQVILSQEIDSNNILLGNIPPYDMWYERGELFPIQPYRRPTKIIAAPPFGMKLENSDAINFSELNGTNLSENLYLELAINWVQEGGRVTAIVPEGLLVSGNRRNIRRFVLANMQVTAIISLGTFLPHSKIKTSILLLDKNHSKEPYDVFLYHIDKVTDVNTFDSRTIPQFAEALKIFEEWSIKRQPFEDAHAMIIPSNILDENNMSVSHYMRKNAASDDVISQYATARLGELAIIQRGSSNFTLNAGGHFPVIVPAMIRPMIIDPEKIDHVIKEKVPRSARTVQIGDIVLHTVGTYGGAAALIEEEWEGTLIYRSVILIRPDPKHIIPEFLAIALNSAFVTSQVGVTKNGTALQGLNVANLSKIIIPVPSKAIQQFLIERMRKARDELFQAQDRLRIAEQVFNTSIKDLSGWGLE